VNTPKSGYIISNIQLDNESSAVKQPKGFCRISKTQSSAIAGEMEK
jgi:hypothetical protein